MTLLETELRRRFIGRIIAAVVLVAAMVAIYLSPARQWMTLERLRQVLDTLRQLWYGPVVFIVVYAAACVFAIPASLFVVSAGIIWGWLLGGVYALMGSMLGAAATYYVARYIGGGMLTRLGPRGAKLERQLETSGFQAMLLLRLSGLPFPVLNVAGGVARMRFGDYLLATFLGIIPSQFVITYSADAIANNTLSGRDAFLRVLLAGALMATLVLVPMWLKRRFVKELPPPAA
jgi:uncharacterized membrane protein YdjX (TVP38/TMEM64 family)